MDLAVIFLSMQMRRAPERNTATLDAARMLERLLDVDFDNEHVTAKYLATAGRSCFE